MRAVFIALISILVPGSVFAQSTEGPVPDRRVAISRDVDFPGGDLSLIRDVTLDACQAACMADPACTAFTFNQRNNSCFPKSAAGEVTPFEGAISGRLLPTDGAVIAAAPARAEQLSFLFDYEIDRARDIAREIGREHSSDEFSAAQLLTSAEAARAAGDQLRAWRFIGAALSLEDRADLWLEYARLARVMQSTPDTRSAVNAARSRAMPALVNAWLRAADPALQVGILQEMADALEADGRGREAIPALRLAQTIQPRRDTEAALDRAVRLFGFRSAGTRVESDSANPRICIEFTEDLVRAGVDYATYVQLPDPALTVEVSDRDLCIDGVAHGARYRFVLREGLPAANGEFLARSTEVTQYVRDRSPAVRFVSRAYVLPRMGEIAVPVETVNLTDLDLTLARVSDRNLIRTIQEGVFARPLYDWDMGYFDAQIGTPVWSGTAQVEQDLNRDVLTRLPMGAALSGQAPGIYVLTAAVPGADQDIPQATQWFILSDLGVATMTGTDGLGVAVRGLGDAMPVAGAEVTLLSEANEVLGTAATDADGLARFAPGLMRGRGAAQPALVTVSLGDDMTFLSLRDPAFDLSDRGVEGRSPPGPIDVFATTDRGAYRAGETIHLTALMRDGTARALPGLPLTAILLRPDGVEYSRHAATNDRDGGHVMALPIGATAPRGTWTIRLLADLDAPPLAETRVLIEDFLPERIDVELAADGPLRIGRPGSLDITARYLFGPPAGDLPVEGDVILTAATGVTEWPGYVFGQYDTPFETWFETLGFGTTGADGRVTLPLTLPEVQGGATQPLRATILARVSEGSGRPVERRLTLPVAPDSDVIGIRPAFDGVVPEGEAARFDLIALTPDLAPTAMQVDWTVNRIETRYQWYQSGGRWDWEPVTRRIRIADGTAALGAAPASVSVPVDWGRYEILVERTDGAYTATSTEFHAGWFVSASATPSPDFLDLSLDAESYAAGDTATLRMVPREDGIAVVTVLSDRVIAMETLAVTAGENTLTLPVTEDWGAGAYVTATVIRPMDAAAGRNPARALGLTHAAVDPGDRALAVTLQAPEVMRPRQPVDIGIHVAGIAPGETAHVTLAAVDLGILNLTGFGSPDPSAHYFGQRALGVELRDIYGQLIDGMTGAMGTVRSGGDGRGAMEMQAPPPTEDLVSFFSGPVTVGADGRAVVTLDLPAFNGTLRLMAVAWSPRGVGQASRDITLRDPVVVTASLPRFMAPGDTSRLLLEVVHADGPAGEMALALSARGVDLGTQFVPEALSLTDGGRETLSVPVTALDPGLATISVTLTTPDGIVLTRDLRLPVQINDAPVARSLRLTLAGGETFTFDDNVFAGLRPGSASATLSVGPLARFDAPGLLATLDRYPYGCTEQVTSRALPLLYFDDLARAMGLAEGADIATRIDDAIRAILANQSSNGAFGLWGPFSGDLWLDAYVTDFLGRARARGHDVPALAFDTALDNLRNRVNFAPDFETGGEEIAYALMVLAREGAAAIGDLRYFVDERSTAFTTPLGSAQLGAALAYYGDQLRADAMFRQAQSQLLGASGPEPALWRADYGTRARDAAAVLALAVEVRSDVVDRDALAARFATLGTAVSTQEAAWALMAAHALVDDMRATDLTIDGAPPEGPMVRLRAMGADAAPVRIANTGSTPTELTVTTLGVPTDPEPAGGTGYAIARAYYTMEGVPADPADIAMGERLVAVLTVTPFGRQEARLMVDDPLPAGFEIDNPNLLRGGDIRALSWLDPVAGEHAEFRQDRFLAAVDWRSDAPFRVAYVVRAVSPGSFHHPAASVEDMYRPTQRARTEAGRVTVTQ